MLNKLKISFFIVIGCYAIVGLVSFLIIGKIDSSIIGLWGLLFGSLLLVAAFPLYKMVFFGGRGIMGVQSPEIPGDEHLHQKIHKSYERENKDEVSKYQRHQDIVTISGITIILISIFII